MYADDLLRPWHDSVRDLVPGVRLFDVHTHTGSNDPDGYSCSPERLIGALELTDGRAVVFTMHEPGGYPPANDRIIEEARASGGRLVPFARLDPRADPRAEAERALDAGALGLKLHPRAEDFRLADPLAEPIFQIAHERGLPVIVHAGRGIPALGRDAVDLAGRYGDMKLILAHEGICDLAWIWRDAAELPNLFFDTAWWSSADHLSLFAHVPPGQILFGSDAPYGTPFQSRIQVTRYALEAGLSHEQIEMVMGGQTERILAGDQPADLGPAPGPGRITANFDLLLDRVHNFLVAGFARMLAGQSAEENLGLARLACEVGDDAPQAQHCRSILALLDRHAHHIDRPQARDEIESGRPFAGLHLVLTAATVARTPTVPAPAPEFEDVEERRRS
jgi:predicted TIM-barrel fold metal-dependent hydrolase